ncbi:MAG: ATP-binding protein, partial [Nitrospiria bacterium]
FSSILKEDYRGVLDEDGVGFLDRIQQSSERMQGLIDDLLSLSRVTTQAKSFQSVELNEVAGEVINDLDDLITRSKGRVEIGDLPRIKADRTQIYHLIQNLIGNGLKYQQKDQAPRISVENVPNENGLIEIRVKDNGIGFDEKYLDRIFKPFQRLHGRKEYQGTGIGLAICNKIVRRHEGEMTATSAPGQGATFIVKLPCDLYQKQKSTTSHISEV